MGVVATGSAPTGQVFFANSALGDVSAAVDREASLSRSEARTPLAATPTPTVAAAPAVVDKLWTTRALDLRLTPAKDAEVDGEFETLKRIGVTGVRKDGFAQVVVAGKVRWVTAEYLAEKKPTGPGNLPLINKPCAGTSSVENGLVANADRVYRAVCNNFPQIDRYGGRDGHGEHSTGRAIDIMTSDVALGTAIAEFLKANAAELRLYNVIWRQRIFTQERGGEGWRAMGSRGGATANHMDHVHVSVY